MSEARAWDLEAVYDAEIAPLMRQIIAICKRENMPMVASFEYASDGAEDRAFCTTCLPFDGADQRITEAGRVITAGTRREASPLMLTLRDAQGNVTASEAIL